MPDEPDDFETFYRQNLRLVYAAALARRSDPDFAEDVAQETFFRAWRHYGRVLATMETKAQRAWLVRTATGVVIDDWRARGKREVAEADAPPDVERTIDHAPSIRLRIDIARALAELNTEDRRIVLLRYYSESSSAEIAALVNMPESTVRYRLAQARKILARSMAAGREEEQNP